MFRILPQREALLSGLLGADLITFQAYAFHRQFANTCRMLRGPGGVGGKALVLALFCRFCLVDVWGFFDVVRSRGSLVSTALTSIHRPFHE